VTSSNKMKCLTFVNVRADSRGRVNKGDDMHYFKTRILAAHLLVALSFAASAEDLSCEYKKAGGVSGAEAHLTIVNGEVRNLDISSFVSGGNRGLASVCGIDASDENLRVQWAQQGAKTILKVEPRDADSGNSKSTIEIVPAGNTYEVNLEGASQEYYCNFGADWPKYIVITRGSKTCRVGGLE